MNPKCKLYIMNCALAFQHLFAVLGGVVVVPVILGMNIPMGLFASGFGTICFYFFTKRQVPVFHGSSFTYMAGLSAIKHRCEVVNKWSRNEYIGRQATGIIFSGLLYFVIAVLVYFVGSERISKLFPPLVVGPIVLTIGLELCPSIISSNIVACYTQKGFKGYEVWVCVVLTWVVIISITCFAPGIWNVFGIIFGILAGYILSAALSVVDWSGVKDNKWILFQPSVFHETFDFWKEAHWDWNAVAMLTPLAIVALMEHLGDITTNGAVCNKDFFIEPGLHRTIAGDGCALVAAGLLGAPPMATYSQNTGVLVITRNFNPDVLAIAGCYAMFLGLITKVGSIFRSIPEFVIGAGSSMMFGIIACMGIKVLIGANVDVSKSRNLMIIAIIIIIGVGFDTGGVQMIAGDTEISPLAVATVVGVVLNLVLPQNLPGDRKAPVEGSESAKIAEDSGNFEDDVHHNSSDDDDDDDSSEKNTVQDVRGAIEA